MTEPVFLDYNIDQLDFQYDLTQKDDVDAYEAEYQRMCEAYNTRADKNVCYGVKYGEHKDERLDIFPAATPNAPVHIFIHGGYWREGDSLWRFIANGLAGGDVTLVMPTYDVDKHTRIGTIVEQQRKAVEWVYRNIAQYGGDPTRITVSGHSAGGHLAAMMMATDWEARDFSNDIIKGVVAIAPISDLEAVHRCRFLREFYTIELNAEEIQALSPDKLTPYVRCPLWLLVGSEETAEYHRHTEILASAWSNKGLPVNTEVYPGEDHFSYMNQLNNPSSRLSIFLNEVSKRAV